ncbi:hypothetical protein CTE05_27470 [Cellulomonas terrae]|uniref:Chaplin domain-containing protein n=1 Tax=Cellulomonas terrae TaxID=311234 RepID=A0A511JMF2_9CELL|nr:hypothetical protein CTE05_27470 [Cellulomonas terrae]
MHTYVRRALQTALVTGGLVAAGASMAHAEEPAHDQALVTVDLLVGGTDGILDLAPDRVVHAPVHVPVDVSGVALAVGGDSLVRSAPATGPAPAPSEGGALVEAPITVPVTVSGVAVGILGDAAVVGGDGASGGTSAPTTSDDTIVAAPVTVPVDVSGVAVGVLGDAIVTGSSGPASGSPGGAVPGGPDGALVAVPVTAPITVADVAVGGVGEAAVTPARSVPGTAPGTTPGTTPGTSPGAPVGRGSGTSAGISAVGAGAAGASMVAAGGAVLGAGATTAAGGAVLADTGWTPWIAFAGLFLVALGVTLRRTATTRRSTRSPFTHPALLDRVPTQRGETPAR